MRGAADLARGATPAAGARETGGSPRAPTKGGRGMEAGGSAHGRDGPAPARVVLVRPLVLGRRRSAAASFVRCISRSRAMRAASTGWEARGCMNGMSCALPFVCLATSLPLFEVPTAALALAEGRLHQQICVMVRCPGSCDVTATAPSRKVRDTGNVGSQSMRRALLLSLLAIAAPFRAVRTTVSDGGGKVYIDLLPVAGGNGVLHLRLVGGRISRTAALRSIKATTKTIHKCNVCTVVCDMSACRGVSPLAIPVTVKFLLTHSELKTSINLERGRVAIPRRNERRRCKWHAACGHRISAARSHRVEIGSELK